MSNLSKLVIALFEKVNKRIAYAALIIFVLSIYIQIPTPQTHTCVPNIRTQIGLSSEGYPYDRGFCEEGYYPEMKWGLEDVYSNSIAQLFLVWLPLSLLIPLAVMLLAPRLPKDVQASHATRNKVSSHVGLVDQRIQQASLPLKKRK